ncbi:MAG: leucine-rich repeat domain-containing protein [Butyrivibrio sp.]|nr:leucine-rich repeat domain-containing protein [Butyrivibrio sp.]
MNTNKQMNLFRGILVFLTVFLMMITGKSMDAKAVTSNYFSIDGSMNSFDISTNGDGWKWDASTNNLTLTKFTGSEIKIISSDSGISNFMITLSGTNSFTNDSSTVIDAAIYCEGANLTICGDSESKLIVGRTKYKNAVSCTGGNLTMMNTGISIKFTDSNAEHGLYSDNAIYIDGLEGTISATKAVYSDGGLISISGSTIDKYVAACNGISCINDKDLGTSCTELSTFLNNISKEVTFTYTADKKVEMAGLSIGKTFNDDNIKYKLISSTEVAVVGMVDKKKKKITIPDTVDFSQDISFNVVSITKDAFKKCTNVKKLVIGNNVTEIEKRAFRGCTSLKTATIGTGLTTIRSFAFKDCKNLATVTIKSTKLTTVEKKAFTSIKTNATIKVKSSKLKAYKKLFKKAVKKVSMLKKM